MKLKKRLWHRWFPVNFAKFLRTPFLTEHLWWLLLKSKSKLRTMCRKNHENFKNSKLRCNLTGSYKKEYIHRYFYIQLRFCIRRHFYIQRLFLYYRIFLHSFISLYSRWKKWIKGLYESVRPIQKNVLHKSNNLIKIILLSFLLTLNRFETLF